MPVPCVSLLRAFSALRYNAAGGCSGGCRNTKLPREVQQMRNPPRIRSFVIYLIIAALCSGGFGPALTRAENNELRGEEILVQPQSMSAAAGKDVCLSVSAPGAAGYQWQTRRSDTDWTDTFLPGYDTDTLIVRVNLSRTVLDWRCVITMPAGYCVYTDPVRVSLTTGSLFDIEIDEDGFVLYDVPLYAQGDYNICWSVSTQMVEDYMLGVSHSQEEALDLSLERASEIYETEWNEGGSMPDCARDGEATNSSFLSPGLIEQALIDLPENAEILDAMTPVSPELLYRMLLMYGPVYLNYSVIASPDPERISSGHMLVLTGVDLPEGYMYINNPWGVFGSQDWDEFQKCFYTGGDAAVKEGDVWRLDSVFAPYWPEKYPPADEEDITDGTGYQDE